MKGGRRREAPPTSLKTLVITDSCDATSDVLVDVLGSVIFRLNTDLIRDYVLEWDASGFRITNPAGATVESTEVGSIYWRKPFTTTEYDNPEHEDAFFYAESKYVVREIYNLCRRSGAKCLVEEGAERRLGKLAQLSIAHAYFNVPAWQVKLGQEVSVEVPAIVKSLSGEPVDSERVLYATNVEGEVLDPRYLWLIQNRISKTADLTVAYVNGRMFGFACSKYLETVDWREKIPDLTSSDWKPWEIPADLGKQIESFMFECGLRYGRLDFVKDANAVYFLEVNPNGQWAWLDLTGEHGLLGAIVDAIRA